MVIDLSTINFAGGGSGGGGGMTTDQEFVIAAALNDLNERMNNAENNPGN